MMKSYCSSSDYKMSIGYYHVIHIGLPWDNSTDIQTFVPESLHYESNLAQQIRTVHIRYQLQVCGSIGTESWNCVLADLIVMWSYKLHVVSVSIPPQTGNWWSMCVKWSKCTSGQHWPDPLVNVIIIRGITSRNEKSYLWHYDIYFNSDK